MKSTTRSAVRAWRLSAAEIRRPKTNLNPAAEFALVGQQLKTGFMGVFTWAYAGDPRKTLMKVALAPLMDMTGLSTKKPPSAKTQEERKAHRDRTNSIKEWEKKRDDVGLAQYTTLKKVSDGSEPYFLLGLPVLQYTSTDNLSAIITMFDGPSLTDQASALAEKVQAPEGESVARRVFGPGAVLANAGLDSATKQLFEQCLYNVTYVTDGSQKTTVFLSFKITKTEAQYLVSTEWMEIRPVDLYPLFSSWVEAEFVSRMYGKSALSISKIANTLPPHLPNDERVDAYGISINLKGEPVWLPKDCNNTSRYESLFSAAGTHQSGEFSLREVGIDTAPTLPVNIPILVDWVNNKFTFSGTTGKPIVTDLAHFRPCNSSMALNILRRNMPTGYVDTLSFYAEQCHVSAQAADYGADPTKFRLAPGARIGEYSIFAINAWIRATGKEKIRYYDIMDSVQSSKNFGLKSQDETEEDDPSLLLAPLARFITALAPGMVQNIEPLFVKYAVSTMVDALGMLQLLASYGTDLATTSAVSNTINKPALDQGVDPNWTPPDCPLLTDRFGKEGSGLIPHQAKVRNIMRDRPDLAAWPIDAGGGKSMLTITDILYEIAHGESAPYLVMCPSHLVANYVSEIVEFTDGKVNVIPITSYNFHTTGLKRYEEILKSAPINTILVIDYGVLKFRARNTVYGTTTVTVYPVIEMIRQFRPGYVMMDESHFLRNMNSALVKTVMNLVVDIKKKRIASGTMNPDSPSDLPGQMAILDPTIFGTRADFNEKYGEQMSGNRVLKWRTSGANSVQSVLSTLKQSIVWAPAKRKEWACALPPRRDRFIAVHLTPAQKEMYDAIFDDMVNQIKKKAETDSTAKKILDQLNGKTASKEDEDAFGDLAEADSEDTEDGMAEDIGPSLQPYLADIERFVTNPAGHLYSKNGFIKQDGTRVPPLTGEDLKSPKAREMETLLRNYLETHDTKVLIFVNYNESADSLFAAMPKELQAQGLLYKTSSKTEMVNKFKKDPSVRWMIGIRKSLEVGLNLQQAGYLLRIEGVWTPGEQEQGDARIERPNFSQSGDKRQELLFDTLVADQTIDITKAARLRAKMLALAKFDNPTNPNYQAIQDIPVLPMNLTNIQTRNDFATNLAQYRESIAELNGVVKDENEAYKKEMIAQGGFRFTPVKQGPVPASAALLARVPYAPGTELYSSSELGLVRVDNFIGLELSHEEEEEGGEDEEDEAQEQESDANAERRRIVKEQNDLVVGRRCHTEYGDGMIIATGVAKKGNFIMRLVVRYEDGTVARNLRVTNVFIVTRTETNGIDMRNKLAQAAGLTVTAPITVPGINIIQRRLTRMEKERIEEEQRQKDKEAQKQSKALGKKVSIGLELSLVNGYMQLTYDVGTQERSVKALEALGFRTEPQYYYTRIRSYKHLIKQASLWAEHGFDISNKVDNDTFQLLADELSKGGLQSHRHYSRLISAGNFRNYLRQEFKPSANKHVLSMFALVTDGGDTDAAAVREAEKNGVAPSFGVSYLCLPYGAGHPASKLAVSASLKAPSTRWAISPPKLSIFVNNLNGAAKVIRQILAAGIQVSNLDELKKRAAHVRLINAKDDDLIDIRGDEDEGAGGKKLKVEKREPEVKAPVPIKKQQKVQREPAVPARKPKQAPAVAPRKKVSPAVPARKPDLTNLVPKGRKKSDNDW